MKFKKFLAALLGVLMITSVMSFTATVGAAEGDIIKESTYHKKYAAERGKTSVQMYDEVNDIVFSRMTPDAIEANLKSSCYINISGQSVVPTAEHIADDDVYVVFYVRSNMELDDNDNPALSLYNAYWGEDAIKSDGICSLVTGNDNFITKVGSDWGKMCFKLATTKTADFDSDNTTPNTTLSINKWTQFAFMAVGTNSTNPIGDWAAKAPEGEEPNMDCAGYAVLSSLEAAEGYDFTQTAQPEKITLTFDKGYTADDDTDVETVEDVVIGKWTGEYVEFPELTAPAEGYELVGWFSDAEYQNKIEDTTAVVVPDADAAYYALWQDNSVAPEFALASMTINGLDASKFGADITAETIEVTLPYGWAKLEELGVMPEITVEAVSPASVEYVAGDSLADGGKLVFTQGKYTDEVDVVFTIGTAEEKTAGIGKVTAGVYSTSGVITLPDGTEINEDSKTRAVGLKTETVEKNGISARKFTPIYEGSELDGTKVSETEYYSSNRGVNLEGYGIFDIYDYESYNAYRALVYYDTGANGEFDIEVNPKLWFQTSNATGTFKTSGTAYGNGMPAVNSYKGDRWEYIYIVKGEKTEALYGKARQPVLSFFATDSNTKAFKLTDDFYYFAEIVALPDTPDFVQYQPTGVAATAVNDEIPGYITGLSDDMEMFVGDAWTAITAVEGYADGKLDGLEAGEYSFRYAANDVLLASEAVTVEVLPGAYKVTFDAQNGTEAVTTEYDPDAAITVPADPEKAGYIFKGWSETVDGEVVDLEGATATKTVTYYAVWQKIEVVYVKGAAEESGDGLTAEAPFKTLAEAAIIFENGGTVVIMDEVAWSKKVNGNGDYNYVNADIVITSVDPVTGTDYPGTLVQTTTLNFDGDRSAKITIRDIEIASWRFGRGEGGSSSEGEPWQYINFRGHPVELGDNLRARTGNVPEGYTVGSTSAVVLDDTVTEQFFPLRIRAIGESGDNIHGAKQIIRDADIGTYIASGKVPSSNANSAMNIDLEFYGNSNTTLGIGNDSFSTTVGSIKTNHYGRLGNVKLLFETAPKSIGHSKTHIIDGSYQVIANNGVNVTVPAFSMKNDNTGEIENFEPNGGYWKLNSAVGGRVDFTETAGTFAVTTDAQYILVTNKATGETVRTRVSDGVSGDANLFDDGAYALTLEAGEYDIAYTDEAVKISVTFENGDADENYTIAKGETATFAGTVAAPAGKVFAAWKSEDGTITLDGNSYTADTYFADGITFVPTFEDDATAPYYYAYGEYDSQNDKYIVDVKIANGKFVAGTLGVSFDKNILAYKGYTLGEGISNNLGDQPDIVKDFMYDGEDNKFVLVWDAEKGIINATEEQVTIVTFEFDILDAENIENGADYFIPGTLYEKYFNGTYYLASPENTSDNPYAVDYVPVYFGETTITEKSYEKATITFNVTFASKDGATVANEGWLALSNVKDLIKLDVAGNTEATVTYVSEDYYVGDTFDFEIAKNGYIPTAKSDVVAEDGMVINVTLLAGDIKDSTDALCGDGTVTLADFVRVVRAFDEDSAEEYKSVVDLNESGTVTVTDLAIVKTNFNKTDSDNTIEIVYAE